MAKFYQKFFLGGKNAGFTLIELLVVVLIIGILAAVAVPQYQIAVSKSRATEALLSVRKLRQAQELFWTANGYYAANEDYDGLDIEMPVVKNTGCKTDTAVRPARLGRPTEEA